MTIRGQPPLRKLRAVSGSKSHFEDHSNIPPLPLTYIHTPAGAPEEAVSIQRAQKKRKRGKVST